MNVEVGVAIFITNIVIALVVVSWCNKKIKDITNPDNWRK